MTHFTTRHSQPISAPNFNFISTSDDPYHHTGLIQNLGRFCNDFQMGTVTGCCRVGGCEMRMWSGCSWGGAI